MSIWTDLLIRHGHIATPTALALIAPLRPARPATPAARTSEPSRRPDAAADYRPATPVPHPLRSVGQLM
jgi:hypothetical protein